jgi:hypothetical protein
MASGHGVSKPDKANHPGRQVHRDRYNELSALAKNWGTDPADLIADANRDRSGGYEDGGRYSGDAGSDYAQDEYERSHDRRSSDKLNGR